MKPRTYEEAQALERRKAIVETAQRIIVTHSPSRDRPAPCNDNQRGP